MPDQLILCLNAGSSSLKYALYQMPRGELVSGGKVEEIGASHREALERALSGLDREPDAISHRVVHGGSQFSEPALFEDEVIAYLQSLTELAPEHQPGALAGIEAARERFPDKPHVACFDTAFFQSLPELAQRLPLPDRFWKEGIRRYGFHGLSYQYLVETLGHDLAPRTILAHLGNGSSLAALKDGRPVETTMGFTPSGGVMMGTRCGDLDPGVILYLMRKHGHDAERLQSLINEEAGLLGVSGVSSDMRTLQQRAESGHAPSRLAVEMYAYHISRSIGGLAAVLGGLDLLVFTGGIGENAPQVREMILRDLGFLNCQVRVMETNEALVMAREAAKLLTTQ